MAKQQSSSFAARAWSFLRFALLWSRKSSAFRRRLILNLRMMPNYLKNLRSSGSNFNGEREYSIEETPIFRLKFHKNVKKQGHFPRIPCINAPIEVEGEDFFYDHRSYHCDEDDVDGDGDEVVDQGSGSSSGEKKGASFSGGQDGSWKEEEVDLKADEFIAEFYRQMKLQRQISYLQYKEMLDRGASK
ncbi:uncharacterized protein LOC116262784 [Nymphaea colorata]|uniref:Cotton fiber protein n=1 Tax=Nymphaea colorata TaxID=210225 RepID=A0A5K0X8L4_9MAGN|nr:uncharacterized protein LOC116262784 [Nymphaea colorata]